MIGEVAAKRTLSFVGLRLVGMDFEPGGWKTVGGPLVELSPTLGDGRGQAAAA